MEIIVSLLCAGTFLLSPLIGIGITLWLEKWLGFPAYLVGWAVPVILVGASYVLYDISLRVMPCEPAGRLACGEPIAFALTLMLGLLCLVVVANFLAQVAVYLFLYARRETQMLRQAHFAESIAPQ